jgi:hypothetical protein
MNWYKLSSKNIKITDEMIQLSLEIAQEIYKFYGKQFKIDNIGSVSFTNPYTNLMQKVFIVVMPDKREQIAEYVFKNNMLRIFPNSLLSNKNTKTNKDIFINSFKVAIIHELTHSIDPKFYTDNKFDGLGKSINVLNKPDQYYIFEPEFDAYSQQITQEIKNYLLNGKISINDVKKWLREKSIIIPPFLLSYKEMLDYWLESDKNRKTNFMIKLKQRIYNEFLQGEKNAI